jgi:hypothetical protein
MHRMKKQGDTGAAALQEILDLVLIELAYAGENYCVPFGMIGRATGLPIDFVRVACRTLQSQGLAFYARGLFNEDGDVAGAGYGATRKGREHAREIERLRVPDLPIEDQATS